MAGKRMAAFLLAMAALGCAVPGGRCGRGEKEVLVGEEAAGSTLRLCRGQTLVVRLPGNPTTGYRWHVAEAAEGILEQQGEPGYAPAGQAIGAGGTFTFSFKVTGSGTGRLRLLYRRPFEQEKPPARTFELTVVQT